MQKDGTNEVVRELGRNDDRFFYEDLQKLLRVNYETLSS